MADPCPGPMVWFDVPADARFHRPAAVLKCAACDYVVVTGSFNDAAHADTPSLREGIST